MFWTDPLCCQSCLLESVVGFTAWTDSSCSDHCLSVVLCVGELFFPVLSSCLDPNQNPQAQVLQLKISRWQMLISILLSVDGFWSAVPTGFTMVIFHSLKSSWNTSCNSSYNNYYKFDERSIFCFLSFKPLLVCYEQVLQIFNIWHFSIWSLYTIRKCCFYSEVLGFCA